MSRRNFLNNLGTGALLTRLLAGYPEGQARLERIAARRPTQADELWLCPWKLFEAPDPWQREVLADRKSNWLLNCSRGSGKTSVAAAMVYLESVLNGAFCLIVSASDRQVTEFHRRFKDIYRRFPSTPGELQVTQSEFANGGRVVTVPCTEGTIRVYHGVRLLVCDESSRIPDDVYGAVRPSLAISKGRTIAVSTPFGQRGWWYESWRSLEDGQLPGWRGKEVPWQECPRIAPRFIEEEKQLHTDDWVKQEYSCDFATRAGGVFDMEAWEALARSGSVPATVGQRGEQADDGDDGWHDPVGW